MSIECKICLQQFKNNLGGQLTNHLLKVHNMTLEDYVVLIEYNEIDPKCKCGLCDERPLFRRGEFFDYAKHHSEFKVKERLYIAKFGEPKCLECGIEVGFIRGNPKQYCSYKCGGKNNGFSLKSTQEKIKEIVADKYGVDNVSKLESTKLKISKAHKGTIKGPLSDEAKKKISESSKKLWQNPEYRQKIIAAAKKKFTNPLFILKLSNSQKNKLSKLHIKYSKFLNLELHGFKSEQVVGRYLVDELNIEKKIAIEINGDYVHANPNKYKEDDIIKLPGNSYAAKEKWESDRIKKENLESLGYKVLIIWESDDLIKKKEELLAILNI
ncbi:MAG: endonuclease domain-containing protein [Chitinophagales bacterium]|nr:endonuclease domain-containing protein [Chitinophagales bacterium]